MLLLNLTAQYRPWSRVGYGPSLVVSAATRSVISILRAG
jgi:hypothetical protein